MKQVIRCSRMVMAATAAWLVATLGTAFAVCPMDPQPPTADAALCSYGTVADINKKVFVSTRNGVQNGGFKVILRNAANQPIPYVEVWLSKDQGSGAYTEQLDDEETVCSEAGYPECASLGANVYTYVETHADANGVATFTQGWGGSGVIDEIQMPRFCADPCQTPPTQIYQILAVSIPFRSTDMNADGKWNECDRSMFFPCQGQTSSECLSQADFNLDSLVDSNDLAILEADFDGACGVNLTTCGEEASGQITGCGVSVTFPGVVCNLTTDWVGGSQMGLTWTAPGAQGGSGTVSGYQLRYATWPITSANFASATPVLQRIFPLPPGTNQSCTVSNLQGCQTYYFAIKGVNSSGKVAPISNVPSEQTTCSKAAEAPETAKVPDVLELDASGGSAIRREARLSYGVSAAETGTTLQLAIFDATGRHVRTLVSGAVGPGYHSVAWDLRSDDGRQVGPGVYFARLQAAEKRLSRTLVVLDE